MSTWRAIGATVALLVLPACGTDEASRAVSCDRRGFPAPEEPAAPYGTGARSGAFAGSGAPTLRIQRWRAMAPGATHLLAYDHVVYAAGEERLTALDSRDGNVRWVRTLVEDASLEGAGSQGLLLTDAAGAWLVDRADGAERWRFVLPDVDQENLVEGAALAGEFVVVTSRANLYVLRAADGTVVHVAPVVGEPDAPAVADGVTYVTGEHIQTMALNIRTGKVVWARDDVGAEFVPPAVFCGRVYMETTSETVALDAKTGKMVWHVAVSAGDATPSVADGLVYATARDAIVALDAATGQERWRLSGIGRVLHQPALSQETAYVAVDVQGVGPDRETHLLAVDTTGGKERARASLGLRPVIDLAVVEDAVIVLLDGGELVAISDA